MKHILNYLPMAMTLAMAAVITWCVQLTWVWTLAAAMLWLAVALWVVQCVMARRVVPGCYTLAGDFFIVSFIMLLFLASDIDGWSYALTMMSIPFADAVRYILVVDKPLGDFDESEEEKPRVWQRAMALFVLAWVVAVPAVMPCYGQTMLLVALLSLSFLVLGIIITGSSTVRTISYKESKMPLSFFALPAAVVVTAVWRGYGSMLWLGTMAALVALLAAALMMDRRRKQLYGDW